MKIAHLIFSMCTGGAETLLVDIVNNQAAIPGNEIHLYILNAVEDPLLMAKIDTRVHIHRLGRPEGSSNPWPVIRLNLSLARLRPDIVHFHHGGLPKYVFGKFRRFITLHALNLKLAGSPKNINAIAISQAVADDFGSRYPGLASLRVIPNGIDTSAIARRNPESPAHSPFRIVCVGRLQYTIKGQDIMLRTLGELKRRGVDNLTVDFIGTNVLGTLPELQKIAREEGVDSQVRFLTDRGREYIYPHLADYDLFCHTARYEGFGLVIAEALAAGLPVVITDEGGPFEVADNGRYAAACFKNGDINSCADAIMAVMADYPKALRSLDGAEAHVEYSYSLRRLIQDYRKAYNS